MSIYLGYSSRVTDITLILTRINDFVQMFANSYTYCVKVVPLHVAKSYTTTHYSKTTIL